MTQSHDSNRLLSALGLAFDILGPISKQRLYEILREKYHIDINKITEGDLAIIQHAIVELFGEAAAQLLMKQVYDALDRLDNLVH